MEKLSNRSSKKLTKCNCNLLKMISAFQHINKLSKNLLKVDLTQRSSKKEKDQLSPSKEIQASLTKRSKKEKVQLSQSKITQASLTQCSKKERGHLNPRN